MSDKWMNLGYDNQDLKPYCEPTPDFKDERRIGEHLSLSLIKFAWLLLVLSAMVSWHIFVFSHHHQNDDKDMSFLRGILITSCGGFFVLGFVHMGDANTGTSTRVVH